MEHPELGPGRLHRVEDGRATVLFEEAGYRVIDLAIARENGLLAERTPPRGGDACGPGSQRA